MVEERAGNKTPSKSNLLNVCYPTRTSRCAWEHPVILPLECEPGRPRTGRTFCSSPSKTVEKSGNFSGCPIGIFAVREMTDARKHGEIEICECVAEPIGPCIRE
jgi:hypothetical protein